MLRRCVTLEDVVGLIEWLYISSITRLGWKLEKWGKAGVRSKIWQGKQTAGLVFEVSLLTGGVTVLLLVWLYIDPLISLHLHDCRRFD